MLPCVSSTECRRRSGVGAISKRTVCYQSPDATGVVRFVVGPGSGGG